MFTEEDIKQFSEKGIDEKTVERQLDLFKTGFPFKKLYAAASAEKGVSKYSESQRAAYVDVWNEYSKNDEVKLVKFVPASGAASRMFKNMFAFLDAEYEEPKTDFEKKFFGSISHFAFYDLARRGIEVERQARKVEIKSLSLCKELSNEKENVYTIDVVCSKGTYIRSLIDDLGKKLGTGAVMTALERTLAMGFTLDDCATLGEMQERRNSGKGFEDVLINIEKMFSSFESVYVSPAQAKRFQNGGALDINRIKKKLENKVYTVYSGDIGFLGLGKCDTQKGELSVERLLVKRD